MIDISWSIFEAKFAGKEEDAFQDLCLHVFCHYCGIHGGVFSFNNHAGIETKDVLFQSKYTGFQAKFFTHDLPQRKQIILDSIIATRKHNTRVQKIFFFLPIDPPGVSKGVDENQKPKWMNDAEATANEQGLEIEWFGTSRFKAVLACDELQVVARHFFDLNQDLWDFISALGRMANARLSFIRNSIHYKGANIHLEHPHELERLDNLNLQAITIISGVGGVGKTAIVKDWIERQVSNETFTIVLQPNEVLEQFSDADMAKAWHVTFDDFVKIASQRYKSCVLVVDSVEKVACGQELSELLMVLHRFLCSSWKIVLTARTLFEQQILSHFKTFLPEAKLEVLRVCPIHADELSALSIKYDFPLPANPQVRDAIRTAFNLSAYLSCKQSKEATSLAMFQEIVWSHFVLNDDPADTAGQTFCQYVEEKLKNDARVISVPSPSDDTKRLEQRGIIAQIKNATGYVIAHDIYEEWAAVRVLDGKLQELGSAEFEKYIESSHGLRQGFQLQIKERLAAMEDTPDPFLSSLLATKSKSLQSDLMLSLIQSEHIEKFLKVFSGILLSKGSNILESIVACTYNFGRRPDADSSLLTRQRPEGFSWRAIIDFAYAHQEALQEIETPTLLQLMQDWVMSNPKDGGADVCSRFAWKAIELGEPIRAYSNQWEEKLADLILTTSACDSLFFEAQIRQHLSAESQKHNPVLDKACKRLLLNSMSLPCVVAIKNSPKLVRDIAWAYWRPKRDSHEQYHELDSIEVEYGLAQHGFEYFPPSPYQGPTYLLLKFDPAETIAFIIDFIDACVADAAIANPKRFDNITLIMPDGKKVEQKISLGLWDCYRDKGFGEHVPYLLKAVHMALEKYLLELAEIRETDDFCATILWLLMYKSTSASLTAVVASIVMAHPMEFVKVGLVLLAERKIFLCDFQRSFAERRPDIARAMLPFPKREHDYYRDEADENPVRNMNLENLIWQYQIVKSAIVPNLKERVQQILDVYASKWDELSQEDKFWLTRIDIRRQNLQVTVDEKTKQTRLSAVPILSNELQELQKENCASSERVMRMLRLAQWGNNRIHDRLPSQDDAYCDIRNVCEDFHLLINETDSSANTFDDVKMAALRVTAAALTMFYVEELPKSIFCECERILIASVNLSFSNRYARGKMNRIGEAVFAMPFLLPHLSWRKRKLIRQRFIIALLNEDETGFLGGDRICDWGMAGVRAYYDRKGDVDFRKWAMWAYRRHFLRYRCYERHLRKPGIESLIWKSRARICKILRIAHIPTLALSQAYDWMAPLHRRAYQYSLCSYAKSFIVRHCFPTKPTNNDMSHLACNVIGFYFPPKLDLEDEKSIVSNVKEVLDYLFCDERKNGETREHLYLSQMGSAYLKQLGYCALNISSQGCLALLKELDKVPFAFQKPELLNCFLMAQYEQHLTENFWRLWNGLLPRVAVAIEKCYCHNSDIKQILDVLALKPLYWDGDETTWSDASSNVLAYFDSLVKQYGNHRYLVVAIIKFVLGAGKRFLLPSLSWIHSIIIMSNDEYDYDGVDAKSIKRFFERIIPQIEKQMIEINKDITTRNHLVSILDYLVALNSMPAFQMRESLFCQSHGKTNNQE